MAERIPSTSPEKAQWAKLVELLEESKQGSKDGKSWSLLRYTPAAAPRVAPSTEPATTPSQLHRRGPATVEHWIELEIVYDDGTPYQGNCVVELPGGRTTEGPPGENGMVRLDGLASGNCQAWVPDLDAEVFAAP